jgi:hypothetical protein
MISTVGESVARFGERGLERLQGLPTTGACVRECVCVCVHECVRA